jgi:flagellar operon protein
MNNIMMGGFTSIQQAAESLSNNKNRESGGASDVSFQDILQQTKESIKAADRTEQSESVRFSKHADARLKQRDITLSDEQITRLNEGTQKAGLKGIKESLVILDNLAFIVNTENRTVVTAMDSTQSDENIYTNIDGAVII